MRTKRILLIAVITLSFFLFLYFFIFHDGLSSNHEEWGYFGDYIGGIGGIVLSCSIFYYTYLIDKEHRRTENKTHVLKLLEVVGASLSYLRRWQDLNLILNNNNLYERGLYDQAQIDSEMSKLEIQIWVNYKTTQVLAYHLYGMDIPDVDRIHQTETNFMNVYNQIKK